MLVILVGGMFLCFPYMLGKTPVARRRLCQSNLASTAKMIYLYAADNGGAFPSNIAELLPTYTFPWMFTCPFDRDRAGQESPDQIDEWMDYIYVYWPEGIKTPTNFPLLYDRRLANHCGGGINILLVNAVRCPKGAPGTVFWDEQAQWLRGFAAQHPDSHIRMPEDMPLAAHR